jgi:hypothetical protein
MARKSTMVTAITQRINPAALVKNGKVKKTNTLLCIEYRLGNNV